MIRGPMRCLCCNQEMSTTDLIGFRCDCDKDGPMGMASMCRDCGKCRKHCTCPEGYTEDWQEVTRRAEAGTLSHQRAAAHATMSDPTPTPAGDRLAALQRAYDMVGALCQPRRTPGAREWLMSIPANPERDPDLVIAAGLQAGEDAVRELAALQEQYDDLNAETGKWGTYGVLQRRCERLEADLTTAERAADAARQALDGLVADVQDFTQAYHVATHDDHSGTWLSCNRGVCGGMRRALTRARDTALVAATPTPEPDAPAREGER